MVEVRKMVAPVSSQSAWTVMSVLALFGMFARGKAYLPRSKGQRAMCHVVGGRSRVLWSRLGQSRASVSENAFGYVHGQ